MVPLRRLLALLGILTVLWAISARAQEPEQNKLLEIPPGISSVDLTGDGKPELILKFFHNNDSAYDHHSILFLRYSEPADADYEDYSDSDPDNTNKNTTFPEKYADKNHVTFTLQSLINRKNKENSQKHISLSKIFPLLAIDIYDKSGDYSDDVRDFSDADCQFVDYRLLFTRKRTYLIKGALLKKEMNYCPPSNVEYSVFLLEKNSDRTPTIPLYYFQYKMKKDTKEKFTDIEDSFLAEEKFIVDLVK
jgi:hypothetical protein